MKRLYILLVLITMSVAAFAQDGKTLYNKYSDLEGVEAVYISPAMFRLIGKLPEMQVGDGDVDIAPAINSMRGFYLLHAEKSKTADNLYADVKKRLDREDFELLMEAKDSGETVRFYTSGDEKTVRTFIMLAREPGETTFISIDGEMSREELEAMIAKAAAKDSPEDSDELF